MSSHVLLPRPVAREPAPWLALVATPLLLATDSLAHAVIIVVVTSIGVLMLRGLEPMLRNVNEEIRQCILLVLAAGLATSADLLLLAYAFPVYRSLALLAPAVLTSMFMHMNAPAAVDPRSSIHYGELMIALLTLGIARELVGHASLLHDLAGPVSVSLFPPEMGFFLAALAPGAFIALGILLAIIQRLRRPRPTHES
ncbi:MAG: Rnf-Nqr domain containing protein [Steroidobacteraceae bacterium]